MNVQGSIFDQAQCVGCGCTDSQACWDEAAGHACSWLRVDYAQKKGVCSCCEEHVEAWDRGHHAGRGDHGTRTSAKNHAA